MSNYVEYGYNESNIACTHHTYIIESLCNLLNENDNKIILDVGCGNGNIVDYLIQQGYNVYGIDASEEGIKIAKLKYPDRFFLLNVNEGTLPPELSSISFDTIISTEVIEHLYDPKSFIHFCKSILEKNGGKYLILSTPYNGYLKNLVLSVLDKWDRHLDPLWDGGHIKFWSKRTLNRLIMEQGFTVDKFMGSGRVPYLWKSMFVKATLK